jgi:hypothetical protein
LNAHACRHFGSSALLGGKGTPRETSIATPCP